MTTKSERQQDREASAARGLAHDRYDARRCWPWCLACAYESGRRYERRALRKIGLVPPAKRRGGAT